MSTKPGKYNISIQRRSDFRLPLQIKDKLGNPLNLTGWSLYSQIWNKDRSTKYLDFTIEYADRSEGRINLFLSREDAAELPCEAFYDLLVENTEGFQEYYLEGLVYTSEGYTES